MEYCTDRESYSLAAGLALGMVCLGVSLLQPDPQNGRLTLSVCALMSDRLSHSHPGQNPLNCGFWSSFLVLSSAVKRLKYWIAINRIYVMVNSKLIAINRKFLSILNVPSFIYFLHHFIFIWMPLSTWKSWLACFIKMFYFIENQYCQTGRYKIKL